jgi:hypothetical protein
MVQKVVDKTTAEKYIVIGDVENKGNLRGMRSLMVIYDEATSTKIEDSGDIE